MRSIEAGGERSSIGEVLAMTACRECKYSAACLPCWPRFALRFIKCECGRYFFIGVPNNRKGAARKLDEVPELCSELFQKIQEADYCVYCYHDRTKPHE